MDSKKRKPGDMTDADWTKICADTISGCLEWKSQIFHMPDVSSGVQKGTVTTYASRSIAGWAMHDPDIIFVALLDHQPLEVTAKTMIDGVWYDHRGSIDHARILFSYLSKKV